MLQVVDEALTRRDLSTTWHHVACFSAIEDDLSQWRGYGGGECGYAVGFDTRKLRDAVRTHRKEAVFVQMIYEVGEHERLAKATLNLCSEMFAEYVTRNPTADAQSLASEFLEELAFELDLFATMTKHPKFLREEEWRIVAAFAPDDLKNLEFRQKRTLLARYLPIPLVAGKEKLPITRICVGPGPAQRVSQVSVDALMRKHDYPSPQIEISKVPFRMP